MSFKLKDSGPGKTREMMKRVFGKKPLLKVGIFGEEGEASHAGSDLTVLAVATIHEFGLGVPERSFIRAWCDEHEEEVYSRLATDSKKAANGELDWNQVLERLGLFIVGGIQSRLSEGIDPPLAASTIKRKGSSVPLIDTGQMRSSITHKVMDKAE